MRTWRRKRNPIRCNADLTAFSGVVCLPRRRLMFQLRRSFVSRSFTAGILTQRSKDAKIFKPLMNPARQAATKERKRQTKRRNAFTRTRTRTRTKVWAGKFQERIPKPATFQLPTLDIGLWLAQPGTPRGTACGTTAGRDAVERGGTRPTGDRLAGTLAPPCGGLGTDTPYQRFVRLAVTAAVSRILHTPFFVDRESNSLPAADPLTIAAIGLMAGALAGVIHEGLGHGGACLLVGGKPTLLTSMNFVWDDSGFSRWASRAVAAGGTIANLLAGALALMMLRRPPSAVHLHYFLWVFAALNLYVGTGYFFYSGMSNIGDWANFIAGLPAYWVWRILLALLGAASYFLCVRLMLVKAAPLTGGDPALRYRRANLLMLIPYVAGAIMSVVAGALNPQAKALILISAVAASLGGTSGLAWGPQMLRDPDWLASSTPPAAIPRHWAWIIAGLLVAVVFVLILGPGIKL
jgi:hypothetical protein